MTLPGQLVFKVGDKVGWVGFLKAIMRTRTGTVVEVLANPTTARHFAPYRIRRDDGVEGVYDIAQLEPACSVINQQASCSSDVSAPIVRQVF